MKKVTISPLPSVRNESEKRGKEKKGFVFSPILRQGGQRKKKFGVSTKGGVFATVFFRRSGRGRKGASPLLTEV